jgi:hypothetical protein
MSTARCRLLDVDCASTKAAGALGARRSRLPSSASPKNQAQSNQMRVSLPAAMSKQGRKHT